MESGLLTSAWQKFEADHHLPPFSDYKSLAAEGTRIIRGLKNHYIYQNSEGTEILDGMAGLCVNVGYGREELVEGAASQMRELPYYNAFFKTSMATLFSAKLASLAPEAEPCVLCQFRLRGE